MLKLLSLRVIVGLIVVGIGLTGFILAMQYEFGSARSLGPGYFPTVLSGILVLLGLVEVAAALFGSTAEEAGVIDWRPLLAVLAAVTGFAFAIAFLGLIPAFFVCVGLTSLAEPKFGILPAAVIAASTSLAAWALFSLLLGMTLPLIRFGF